MKMYLKHLPYIIVIVLITLFIASFTVTGAGNKNILDVSGETPTNGSAPVQELKNSFSINNTNLFTVNVTTQATQSAESLFNTFVSSDPTTNIQTRSGITPIDTVLAETSKVTITATEIDSTIPASIPSRNGNGINSTTVVTISINLTTKARTAATIPLKPNNSATPTKFWSPTPRTSPSAIRTVIGNPINEVTNYPEPTETPVTTADNFQTLTKKSSDLWTMEPGTPIVTETVIDLTNPDVWYDRGLLLEKEGRYEEALAAYNNALAIDPAYVDAWFQKGLSLEKMGRNEEALLAYNTTLDINPLYIGALDNRNLLLKNLISARTPFKTNFTVTGESGGDGGEYPWIYLVFGGVSLGIFLALIILLKFGIGSGNVYRRPNTENFKIPHPEYESRQIGSSYHKEPRKIDISEIKTEVLVDSTVDPKVFEKVLTIAIELGREGREGKSVGTSFIIGDSENVLLKSKQLILNPFEGHHKAKRSINKEDLKENIKELAQLDGAFVISDDGIVEAAGRYITIDTSDVKLPRGFGTRHASVAGISKATKAIGIVLSQSGGTISIFKDGEMKKKIRY